MAASKETVLFIGQDIEYQSLISGSFTDHYDYHSARSTQTGLELVQSYKFNIVIFDENILYTESLAKKESASIKLIYKESVKNNEKVIFVLTYLKMTNFIRTFEKINSSTLLFKRTELTSARLAHALSFLKQPYYRAILSREISVGKSYPVPIYFMSSDEKNKKVYIEANKKIEENVLSLLQSKNMYHLFIRRQDFNQYLEYINSHFSSPSIYSLELNKIRDKTKFLLSQLCDDSLSNDISSGGNLLSMARDICKDIEKIINKFPSLIHALEELPFPRWGTINHYINSAIYTFIFSKICLKEHNLDLVVAALVHDIGLSKLDFNLVLLKEEVRRFPISKKIRTELHVNYTIDLLLTKKFLTSKIIHETILTHHEAIDGTGTPNGLSKKDLKPHQMIIPLVDIIDETRTVNPGDRERTFRETLIEIIKKYQSTERFGKPGPTYSPEIVQSIVDFIKLENA